MIKFEGEPSKTLKESKVELLLEANNRLKGLGKRGFVTTDCAYQEPKLDDGSWIRVPAITFSLEFDDLSEIKEVVDHLLFRIKQTFDYKHPNSILWLRKPLTLETIDGVYRISTRVNITTEVSLEAAIAVTSRDLTKY